MARLNASEQFPNITGQLFFDPASSSCTGSWPPKTVEITTYSTFMILSLIGNLLIVAVFCRNRTLRTPVHYFIVNMAISDLIIPVIALPCWISSAYYDKVWLVEGVLGNVLCKLAWIPLRVSVTVSILSMVVIAAERFHIVLFSMKSPLIFRNKCCVIIAAIWLASLAFRAHYLYAVKLVTLDSGLHCLFQWEPASYTKEVSYITTVFFTCLSFLSAIVLTVLYSSITIFLYRQKNNLHFASEIAKKRARRNRNITCMLVTIVVVFYAVCIPNSVLFFNHFFLSPGFRIPCIFWWLGTWVLPLCYPVINPVVYYRFNEEYRQGFRELLCSTWPCYNRCNRCLQPSVLPQGENNVHNAEQARNAAKNIEIQEQ